VPKSIEIIFSFSKSVPLQAVDPSGAKAACQLHAIYGTAKAVPLQTKHHCSSGAEGASARAVSTRRRWME
jgi:hypothetical protein